MTSEQNILKFIDENPSAAKAIVDLVVSIYPPDHRSWVEGLGTFAILSAKYPNHASWLASFLLGASDENKAFYYRLEEWVFTHPVP